ncbi:hypothetical protein [Actinacidiphila acidipaludis]|uniref:Uncharacterized protein n=1 Tax=Actinacidiphila acidipaludis TaxID=2873382 RepID=A0ABS7QI40_9ACTN|nr:hypothetical protein [Streptomyces acidipaludis]MBY8881444.1 hypothetical protein [Streptomyces acidipaludis]
MPPAPYSVSVSIMAHPSRAARAERLRARFSVFPARVCYDPEPDGEPSTVRTARLAWQPWDPSATHHLVLQDDVTPTDDFEATLLEVVGHEPAAALGLFCEWGSYSSYAVRLALLSGHAWTESVDSYFPTVAGLLPREAAAGLAAHLASRGADAIDDVAVFSYLTDAARLRVLLTIPQLVQHDGDVSLIGNDGHGVRRSTLLAPELARDGEWWRRPRLEGIRRIAVLNFAHDEPLALDRWRPGCGRGEKRELGEGFADTVTREEIAAVWRPVLASVRGATEPDDRFARRFRRLVEVAAYTVLSAASLPGTPAGAVADPDGDPDWQRRLRDRALATWVPGVLRLDAGLRDAAALDRATDTLAGAVDAVLTACRKQVLPPLDVRRSVPGAPIHAAGGAGRADAGSGGPGNGDTGSGGPGNGDAGSGEAGRG